MNAAPRVASRRAAALACAVALTLGAAAARANPDPDQPTPLEAMRLPHYCQGQFIPQFRSAPGYSQPGNCGAFMNHFCYGLNFLNRANNLSAPKGVRQNSARRARQDIDYTKQHMTPGCSLTNDVMAADMRLRAMEMFLK